MNNRTSGSHNQDNPPDLSESGISLLDILFFLKDTYKIIAIAGLAGLAAAIAYLVITPKQYEATSQIMMAQVAATNNTVNPAGVNIEEPALLILRMSLPTSFTAPVITACGFKGRANASLDLSKSIKLTVSKGATNAVQLKTFGKTALEAQECNLAIFDLIKATQSLILTPYINEAKLRIAGYEERLSVVKDLLAKTGKLDSVMSPSYPYARDEIRYLLDEITAQKNIITSSQNRPTRLIAPVYAPDMPIFPAKRAALAAGLLGGMFFGLLFAVARKEVVKMKGKISGAL